MGRKDGEDSYAEIQNFSDFCVSKLPVLNVNGEWILLYVESIAKLI